MGFVDLLVAKQRELLAALETQRQSQHQELSNQALLWMALGPGWTPSLAKRAGFPSGPEGTAATLQRIASSGFATKAIPIRNLSVDPTTGRSRLVSPEELYCPRQQTVREIIERAIEDPSKRQSEVNRCVKEIVKGLKNAVASGTALPPQVTKWMELAERLEAYPSLKDFLLQQVDKALALGNEPEAVAWVEAAFPLERALGGEAVLAVLLAGLRVQLHRRRASNYGHLQRFLPRADQIQAFNDLLMGSEEQWALHFAGTAGVGKTMLVRFLESRAAPERGASTARLDFDYLNPEYPATRPALLLVQFAGELRLQDEAGLAASYFQSFYDKAQTMHERVAADNRPLSPLERVREAEFGFLLDMFANAARNLPQPVILMLDTCEELAKMMPDGSLPQGVEATFEILEQLHERLSSLRVVFCGRRPLASSGAGGWSACKTGGVERPRRPYLGLHEIRAFNENEARRYLEELADCRRELIPAILPHCEEKGYAPLFQWNTGAVPATSGQRYSPFELSLYGAWARQDHQLTAQQIADSSQDQQDQYVHTRIVARIENRELVRLLPAIAWLGEVDAATVARLAGLKAEDAQGRELFAELEQQEWVDGRRAPVLAVEPSLRKRLLDYFRKCDRSVYEDARTESSAYLEELSRNVPIREISVVHLEALLEMLQPEPSRAAAWWRALEERIAAEQEYAWILDPTARLLAEEHWPKTVLDGSHIRAAIAATRAAAQLHAGAAEGARETWRLVEQDASHHPDELTARRLALMARAIRGEIYDYGPQDMTEDSVAALLTGLEWAIDRAELGDSSGMPHPESIVRLGAVTRDSAFSLELQAFAWVLAGRALAAAGRRDEGGRIFRQAFGMAELFESGVVQRWLHWVAPEEFASRLRLEFLRWAFPEASGPGDLEWWLETPEIQGIDSDRLASAVLEIQAARRPRPADEHQRHELISRSRGIFESEPPQSPVHRRFAPYFSVAAEELAYAGNVQEAIGILVGHSAQTEASGVAYYDTLAADRSLTQIIRRLRLADEGHPVRDSILRSDDVHDRTLAWSIESLSASFRNSAPSAQEKLDHLLTHARWSTCVTVDRQMAEAAVRWAQLAFQGSWVDQNSYVAMSCVLDLVEVNELAGILGLPSEEKPLSLTNWVTQSNPVEELTLQVRGWALGVAQHPSTDLVERVGIRRAARIALEEGELLALRLPERAFSLLGFARTYFGECRDLFHQAIATACGALALVRTTKMRELSEALDRLKGLFEAGAGDLLALESWNRMEATVEGTPGAWLDVQPEWTRPWMFRIAACVARQRDAGETGGRSARVFDAWRKFVPQLPAEVAGWQAPVTNESLVSEIALNAKPLPLNLLLNIQSSRKSVKGFLLEPDFVTLWQFHPESGIRVATPAATAPYRTAAEALSQQIVPSFREAHELVVDRFASWVNWESILDPTGKKMYFRRADGAAPPNLEWGETSVHTLTLNHAGADLAGTGFGGLFRWTYAHEPQTLSRNSQTSAIQVLHVIADVLEVTNGVRLSLRDPFSPAEGRGQLLRAEDLAKMLPQIRLCILQLPLQPQRYERAEVDREKGCYLRACAAEVQLAGIGIVVTLPSLSFDHGAAVLRAIGEAASNPGPQSNTSIFEAVRRAREDLFTLLSGGEVEAAFDVCYYG